MERLLREAEEENVEDITLEVRASNAPAIALYEAYGFQKEAVRKNYYSGPTEDALIYWKRSGKSIDRCMDCAEKEGTSICRRRQGDRKLVLRCRLR